MWGAILAPHPGDEDHPVGLDAGIHGAAELGERPVAGELLLLPLGQFIADLCGLGTRSRNIHTISNANRGNNSLGLVRASELYQNAAYRRLVEHFDVSKVYILSAGWGLIAASFLTPDYDITFSARAKEEAPWKFRGKSDHYEDLCHLPADTAEPVVFFGGKDYVPLFCKLTEGISSRRTIFYRASDKASEKTSKPPKAPGCVLQGFPTASRTNWHYECVKAFLEDRIAVQP